MANKAQLNNNQTMSISYIIDKINKSGYKSLTPEEDKFYRDNLVETKQERQILQIKLESVGVLVDDLEVDRPIIEVEVDESQTNRPVAVTQTDAS